ncbi:hypothetical protein CHS0354_009964 [Potamilus streckersoni]|uniref:Rho GTPase-activating protein 12 n=1 Tax=Potamilus streckersoni TaxID=2493646 RepID=A0AAE0TD55_9BIVA|nr:hypothetical protein CHS0354_009964 [Potamilus streckersoni]
MLNLLKMAEESSEENVQKTNSQPHVEALYSFEYIDDFGTSISMKEGEIYRLLSVESDDWWEVCRLDDSTPFYVPKTYVRKVTGNVMVRDSGDGSSSGNVNVDGSSETPDVYSYVNATWNHDEARKNDKEDFQDSTHTENITEKKYRNETKGNGLIYANTGVAMETSVQNLRSEPNIHPGQHLTFTERSKNFNRTLSLNDGGDYANLEDFRQHAGIPSPIGLLSPESPESDGGGEYANLADLNIHPLPPLPDTCVYKKTLLDKWDVFLDPTSNRIFYVDKSTNSRTWKPPRDKNVQVSTSSCSESEYEDVTDDYEEYSNTQYYYKRKSHSMDYGHQINRDSIPEEWNVEISDTGNVFYVHETTQEKWSSTTDQYGRRYYYRLYSEGGAQSVWHLPRIGSTNLLQKDSIGNKSPRQSRDSKAKSMFVGSDINPASIPPTVPSLHKCSTLPGNVKTAVLESVENRLENQQKALNPTGMPQLQLPQEPLAGILNKARVMENGKKVTKKWSTSFVVLTGSNLVFYKDQKAMQMKQGSPGGKCEFIVSLPTAIVELNPKDFSSRKNVVMISYPENQVLIQHDDERKIMEWFTKLKLKLEEVGAPSEVSVDTLLLPENDSGENKRRPSFKSKDKETKHARKPSEGGGVERDKGFIRNVLVNFLNKRQPVTALKARGIYKDAVFGSDLKQLCEREKQKVPLFLQKAIAAIENRGLHHDGLYRVGGNVSTIQKLRCAVDAGQNVDLDDVETWDVHVIAGALKLFFRELKEPVFTYSLFDKFVKALVMEKNAERLKGMKAAMNELPKCNYETLKVLFGHLTKLIESEKDNRMNSYSVAIVFGPSLIWPEIEAANLATSIVYQSKIVEYILVEYKNIFR